MCFRFDDLFPLEPYSSWTEKDIRERLLDSDAYAAHPSANVTTALVQRVMARFNNEVFEQRADILIEHLRSEYNRDNISKYAVIDVAKQHKLHYFLGNDSDKMVQKVMAAFR